MRSLRERIKTVKNTKKTIDAMKLVAAAKVKMAQDSAQNGKSFSEILVKIFFYLP